MIKAEVRLSGGGGHTTSCSRGRSSLRLHAQHVRGLFVDETGNVGVGWAPTQARLDVRTTSASSSENTVHFSAPSIGPRFSHIHWGADGSRRIRSANPTRAGSLRSRAQPRY